MKKLCALVVVLLLGLAGCGGDDGGGEASGDDGGDREAFCDRLEELEADDELDLDEAAAFEAFDELLELAPEEIDSDLERIQEAFEELAELDDDDPEAFGAAFEIILDPRVASALEDFTEYAEEECGVEVEGGTAFEDLSEDLSGDLSSDVSDDSSDDFSDDLSDDDLSPSQRLRAFLDENYPDFSDLAGGIGSAELGEGDLQVTLTLDETTDGDTAVAICEATLEFAEDDEVIQVEVEVEDLDDNVLATGDFGDGCEAA